LNWVLARREVAWEATHTKDKQKRAPEKKTTIGDLDNLRNNNKFVYAGGRAEIHKQKTPRSYRNKQERGLWVSIGGLKGVSIN